MFSFKNKVAAILLASMSFVPVSTLSAQNVDQQAIMRICYSDYQSFCAGVVPGGGRIIRCLADQAEKLNPVCREAVIGGTSCLADAKRLCGDVPVGDGRMMTCLKQNLPNVSPECGNVLMKFVYR